MPADNEQGAPESSTGEEQSYLTEHDGQQDSSPANDAQGESSSQDGEQGSSPAAGEENRQEPKSPLDIVKSAMKANADEESPASEQGKDTSEAAKPEDGKPEDGKPEEGKEVKDEDLPFHKHPRFQEIIAKNRELESKVQEYEQGETAQFAKNYLELNDYLHKVNLGPNDFNNGLAIMAAMRNDPNKALEMLEPYYNALMYANGRILPEDIQQKIDDGIIDEETGKALAKERAQNQQYKTREQMMQERAAQNQQEEQRAEYNRRLQEFVGGLKNAVSEWESAWAKSDPDYPKLMPMVRDRFAEMQRLDPPKSAEEAVKMVEKAKAEVIKNLSPFRAPKEPVTPGPTGGKSTSSQPVPEPKSGLDVVKNALAAEG